MERCAFIQQSLHAKRVAKVAALNCTNRPEIGNNDITKAMMPKHISILWQRPQAIEFLVYCSTPMMDRKVVGDRDSPAQKCLIDIDSFGIKYSIVH